MIDRVEMGMIRCRAFASGVLSLVAGVLHPIVENGRIMITKPWSGSGCGWDRKSA
jgi:hypothetical protein